MPLRQRPAITVILAVMVTACGTAKASSPIATTSSVALRPSTVASAAPATSPAPAPTTAPPATTTVPVTTTIVESDESIMQRAITRSIADLYRCFAAPAACDVSHETTGQGTLRSNLMSNAKHLSDRGWRGKDDPRDPTYATVTSATVAPDRLSAVALACLWDTGIVYEPNAAPDGTDILVNDLKMSYDMRYNIVFEGGSWVVISAESLAEHVGENSCVKR